MPFEPSSLVSLTHRLIRTLLSGLLAIALLGSCSNLRKVIPQVSAEDRLFLNVSVNLVGSTILPKQSFEGDTVGGISAIAYDVPRDRLYALSDDRDRPRFYTLKMTSLSSPTPAITVESVTYLKDNQGNPYASGQLDPEGLALTPAGTLLISSEGSPAGNIAPAIGEYELTTGQLKKELPLPERYIPLRLRSGQAQGAVESEAALNTEQARPLSAVEGARPLSAVEGGIQENLGFEALTINVSSGAGGIYEPYRLFVATEGPLLQDLDFAPDIPYKNRLLHYLIDPAQTTIVSEHMYEMDLAPTAAVLHGLSEIALLDQSGHFLGIERSYGFKGFAIKLYQLASGGATDISAIASLQNASGTSSISPIRKQLVLDLATLPNPLQNYEAMTFGPDASNRRKTLLIMSDDNFDSEQETTLLVFQLTLS
jgi:hypothetical protein